MSPTTKCILAAALALPALPACQSFSSAATARTLDRGRVQLAAMAGATGTASGDALLAVPQVDLAARYGATDRVELGARLWYLGVAAGARVALVRAPDPRRASVDLALGATAGYTAPNKLTFDLPLAFGVNVGGGHQLVFTPRVVQQVWFPPRGAQGPARYQLFAGGSVGFAWRLAPAVALLPEFAVLAPLYSDDGVATFAGAGVGVQAGLGVLINP